jgi:hypothetical protein
MSLAQSNSLTSGGRRLVSRLIAPTGPLYAARRLSFAPPTAHDGLKPGISSQPRRPVTALQNIPYTAICFRTLKVPSKPLFPKLAKQNSPAIVGLGRDNPNVITGAVFDGSKQETEHYVPFSGHFEENPLGSFRTLLRVSIFGKPWLPIGSGGSEESTKRTEGKRVKGVDRCTSCHKQYCRC